MEPVCYVVGSMAPGPMCFSRPGLIIAADGGYAHLKAQGAAPDITVGDFDSLGYVPSGNVIHHPAEKADTDTMLALRLGLKRGYNTFVIYGCLGGRLDHAYANLQALAFLAQSGARGYLLGSAGEVITVVQDGAIQFPSACRGIVSVFCFGGTAEGVYERGLKYTLTDAVLTSGYPLGVSNEFTGEPARVVVRDGELLVMWNEDAKALIERL